MIIFSSVNIIISLLLTQTAYIISRETIIQQLSDQIEIHGRFIVKQLNLNYLKFLEPNIPDSKANIYLQELLSGIIKDLNLSEVFIFNSQRQILFQSEIKDVTNLPVLTIYNKEIFNLNEDSFLSTRPFKAADGKWYMWGITKLSDKYWLCVRENAERIESVERLNAVFPFYLLAGVLLTLVAAFYTTKIIADPVRKLAIFSEKIGKGDFFVTLPGKFTGELEILSKALDQMKSNLFQRHKEKEALLAQIAHEIRNPLGGIELFSGLVKEDLIKAGIKNNSIDFIMKEISGLKELINHYLTYSRPLLPNPVLIHPKGIIMESFQLFQKQINGKNIKMNLHIPENFQLNIDPRHLKQLFINLISNSIDSAANNGIITVQGIISEKENKIIFSDNGPGFSEEYKKNPFQPFHTTKEKGTGLGLAVCKKICQENNCQIEIDFSYNNGALIYIKQNKKG